MVVVVLCGRLLSESSRPRAAALRLTVGNHGHPDCVLFSSSQCATCVLDVPVLILPILLRMASPPLPHFAVLQVDAAWPRLGRSLGLMRRCRAKP